MNKDIDKMSERELRAEVRELRDKVSQRRKDFLGFAALVDDEIAEMKSGELD